MNMIMRCVFGSHLYGTDTPESDRDYKGIYLPEPYECYTGKIEKSINISTGNNYSKNSKDDIDEEIYSLQYFMTLAKRGEMIVIDMLHVPDHMIIESSNIWKILKGRKKELFYSKNLSGYLGYIRTQTAKYGIKGSRLAAMKEVINCMERFDKKCRMEVIWNLLPINEYCMFVDNPKENRWKHYECCGKQLTSTQTIENAYAVIKNMYDRYGERAKKAEKNEGIDWKAVSHAFRAGYQLKEIYETGDLVYPLKNAEYIKDIKLGKFNYKQDKIGETLETLYNEIVELSNKSKYPETISEAMLDNFIVSCY